MKEIQDKIIEDLKFLADKAQDPLVKIAYGMAATIVNLHFEDCDDNK